VVCALDQYTIELTYEILGIRPLLIDKLSNYCIPKDGVLLPRMDSYSSALPLIVDPFIIKGCNYYRLRRSILIIEAEAGDNWAWGLYLATRQSNKKMLCKPILVWSSFVMYVPCL
jgi:hypothetical protein